MDAAYTRAHIEEDREHWWFQGRLTVLHALLRRVLPSRRLRILELGCGTGNVLGTLGQFGELVGMEMNADLRAVAVASGLDVRPGALPGETAVEAGSADVVLMLDVIEHLDDDVAALRAARDALRPGGILVVTVPAYAWLWSAHDQVLGHRRRYTARRLRAAVRDAGFQVDRTSYFSTLLFPAIALVRLLKRARGDAEHDLKRPPSAVNRALAHVFGFERHLLRVVDLPFGSSIVLVGRK